MLNKKISHDYFASSDSEDEMDQYIDRKNRMIKRKAEGIYDSHGLLLKGDALKKKKKKMIR